MSSFTESKLPDVGMNIFSVMSTMAAENNAINLSQGFPDFPVSEELIERVNHYMKQGLNQYAPMPGVPELRKQIAKLVDNKYNIEIDQEKEITITSGATEALFSTITALVKTGDEVIVLDPSYDSYDPAIRLAGGKAVHVSLQVPDFSIDWPGITNAISDRTSMIIVNTPHNPSGTLLSIDDMLELERVVQKHDLLVISDEVYEHIVFDENIHKTAQSYPGLRNRTVSISSFGKTFHATGWKVGYVIAPAKLSAEIRKMHQYITFSVSTPVQWAIAEYLQNEDNYINLGKLYQEKRDFFLSGIKNSKFRAIPSQGTYFQLLSYKDISSIHDVEMAKKLTVEYGVASIPISVFDKDNANHHLLRFCFAKSEETLYKATEILCKI